MQRQKDMSCLLTSCGRPHTQPLQQQFAKITWNSGHPQQHPKNGLSVSARDLQ